MRKRYFTVAEANQLLPKLNEELLALQDIHERFETRFQQLQNLKNIKPINEQHAFTIEGELDFMQIEANLHISNIQNVGADLKDIHLGLIDFPAKRDGQDVLLCWKQGELEIAHFHGYDEGFNGRKPL